MSTATRKAERLTEIVVVGTNDDGTNVERRLVMFASKVGKTYLSNFMPNDGGYLVETVYQQGLLHDKASHHLFGRVMDLAARMGQRDFAEMIGKIMNKKAQSEKSLNHWTYQEGGVKKTMVAILAKIMANVLKPGTKPAARKRFNTVMLETLGVDVSTMQRGEEKTKDEKRDIMIRAMMPKYFVDGKLTKLGELLVSTKEAYLMEFGRSSKDASLWTAKVNPDTRRVIGQNLCGECLMAVRGTIREALARKDARKEARKEEDEDEEPPRKKSTKAKASQDEASQDEASRVIDLTCD
jgi:predicted NAD-dependent protein-ADP-ribosyltransferase YbiA (DUF1768 family)